MSRVVELDKDLSDEDKLYLAQRDQLPLDQKPRTPQEVEKLRLQLAPPVGVGVGLSTITGTINTAGITAEEYQLILDHRQALAEAEGTPTIDIAGPGEVMEESGDGYDEMSKDDLIVAIGKRNETKAEGEKISNAGNKSQLVAALRQDDAALASAQH